MGQALCSVVIVSFQSGPLLFATVKRALAQARLAEVLVVNNGNPPHMLARLSQMALSNPKLKIITGQGNIGIAKASNLAAAQAAGDYLLFLHPDCLIGPGALIQAMEALEEWPDAMVAGAWLLNPDGSEQQGGHAHWVHPRSAVRHLLRFGKRYKPTAFVPGSAFEVPAVADIFLCVRKANFHVLGGFDERFFICVEDVELCRRVRNAGKKVIKLPQVQAVHMHSTMNAAYSPFIAWQHTKGLMYYYKKHERRRLFPGARLVLNGLILLHHAQGALAGRLVRFKRRFAWRDSASQLRAKLLEFFAMGLVDLPEGEALKGKQILVTGATNQIGACVLRRLVAEGASVIALSRQSDVPFLHERVLWQRGDMGEPGFDLPDIRLDAVVHCAPLWFLPMHLRRFAQMGAGRLVAFGTTSMFAHATSRNWHEKEKVDALRASEKAIEEVCDKLLMRWTLLRPTTTYGLGMDKGISRIMRFIRLFKCFPVYPPALGLRHPIHADDAAKAAMLVLGNEATFAKAYNLSGAEMLSFREMVERVFSHLGMRPRVVASTALPFALDVAGKLLHKKDINAEAAYRMNDDIVFFHDAAEREFGFSPRGFLKEG